jgi:hypothetical protein
MGSASAIGAAVVALLLIAFFYRARTVSPRLLYQQRALELVGDTHVQLSRHVEIVFQHQRLPRVTKTYVVLWNTGRRIRGSDLSTDDPLRFEVLGDAQILTAQVVKTSSGSNVSVCQTKAEQNKTAAITFDELGPGEGAVLEIFHTSSERFGVFRGAISGMPRGPQDRGRVRHPFNPLPSQVPGSFKAIGNTVFVLTFGIGALLVLLSAFASYLAPVFGPHVGPAMSIIEGVSDVMYAGLAFIVLAQTRRRFPEDLVIPELE